MIDRPAHTPRQRSGGRFSGDTGMGPEEPAKAIKDSRGRPPLVPQRAVVRCPDQCASQKLSTRPELSSRVPKCR